MEAHERMDSTNERLKQLVADLFKCDIEDVTDTTGPGDIPGWDSLGHVTLMVAIQERFGRHVPVEDAIEVESIADLTAILDRVSDAV